MSFKLFQQFSFDLAQYLKYKHKTNNNSTPLLVLKTQVYKYNIILIVSYQNMAFFLCMIWGSMTMFHYYYRLQLLIIIFYWYIKFYIYIKCLCILENIATPWFNPHGTNNQVGIHRFAIDPMGY